MATRASTTASVGAVSGMVELTELRRLLRVPGVGTVVADPTMLRSRVRSPQAGCEAGIECRRIVGQASAPGSRAMAAALDRVSLPTGTVTFLVTDIEGSTSLARTLGDRWPDVLDEH